MAPEDGCSADMLVLIHWQGRKMAVPLSQLAAIDPDESTAEAIGDWHYWVAQGSPARCDQVRDGAIRRVRDCPDALSNVLREERHSSTSARVIRAYESGQ
jgi:hypothetical protein